MSLPPFQLRRVAMDAPMGITRPAWHSEAGRLRTFMRPQCFEQQPEIMPLEVRNTSGSIDPGQSRGNFSLVLCGTV